MNKKGFTLMELLVTVVVLGIIVGLSLPLVRNIQLAQTEKRYITYLDSVGQAAKLYTDSYSEDLYLGRTSGCVYVSYDEMNRYKLLKDIDIRDISCNSEFTAVKIVKFGEKYYYKPFIGCGTKKNGKASNPDIFRPSQFEASTICNSEFNQLIAIRGEPASDDSITNKTYGPKVKLVSETGVNKENPPRIFYGYSYDQSPNVIDGLWTPVNFKIPSKSAQLSLIRKGVTQNFPANAPLNSPTDQTGDLYLVIRVELLEDLNREQWRTAADNYVYIGPYRVDNEAPNFNDSIIKSSAGDKYQSKTPKLDFKVVDEHFSEEKDMKMCYSYDDDDECPLPSSAADLAKMKEYKTYSPFRELKEISNKYDGVTHTIHVTVADAAGNYSQQDFEYTVSKSYKLTFDPTEGSDCDHSSIYQIEDKAWNEKVVNETGFNVNEFCTTKKTGYNLVGWYTEKEGQGTQVKETDKAKKNLKVYAYWKPKKYKLSYDVNGGKECDPNYKMVVYKGAYGTMCTPTRTGYTFAGWYTKASGGEKVTSTTKMAAHNTTIYAHWTINTYKLVYNEAGGTSCSPAYKSIKYREHYGSLCEPTRNGYVFLGWYTTSSGGNKVTANTTMAAHDTTIHAHWAAREYTLTFESTGGSTCNPRTKKVKYGDPYGTLCNPTKNGYTFGGWYTSASGGTQVSPGTKMGTKNVIIYAHWNPKPVYITYMGNGNTGGSTARQTCYYNTTCKLSTNGFTKTGYSWTGWYPSATSGTKLGDTVKLTGNLTVYAHWELAKYKISYNGNGHNSGSTEATECAYNANCQLRSNGFAKIGHDFAGWYNAATNGTKYGTYTQLKTNITAYAHWDPKPYAVVYNGNTNTGGSTPQTNCDYNVSCTLASNGFTKTGYSWTGWWTSTSGGTKYGSTVRVTGKLNVYAQWKINTYTLTYDSNGGHACSPTSKALNYNAAYGTLCTPTRNGYTFAGWWTAASGGTKVDASTKMAAKNTTIYAHWDANPVKITYKGNGNTGGTMDVQTCLYNQTCTLKTNAFTKTGHSWTGWYPSATGGTALGSTVKLTGNLTVYAQWKPNTYTLTFNSNGGSNCSSKSVTFGSAYGTLCTTNRKGYTFAGWWTAATGGTKVDANTKMTTTGATIYAHWTANTYTLTYNSNGGSACSNKSVAFDSAYGTLCTPTRAGYTLAGWYTAATGGTKVDANTKMTTLGATIYAHWTLNSSVISNLRVTSSTTAYNNKKVKVTFDVGVSATEKTKIKVCVSTSACTNSDFTKSYSASGYDLTFTGNYDGSTKKAYVGIKDQDGNIVKQASGNYVVYKECTSKKAKGDWQDSSTCTKKCGSGTKNQVSSLVDTHLGTACLGTQTRSVACNTMSCCSSMTTVYGNWSGWSSCSKKCGGGTQTRTRSVTKKSTYDGSVCSSSTESGSQACNTMGCCSKTTTSCGSYGSWGSCSKKCGGGTHKRSRTCTKKSYYDGSKCSSYTDTDSGSCNTMGCCSKTTTSCGSYGSCSKKCGGGTKKRTCTKKSSYNGSTCSTYSDSASCNTMNCCGSVKTSCGSWGSCSYSGSKKSCWKKCKRTCKIYSKYNGKLCQTKTETNSTKVNGYTYCSTGFGRG